MQRPTGQQAGKRRSRPATLRPLQFAIALSTSLAALNAPVRADDPPPVIRDNFGGIGLIEMPSARMAEDGTIYAGASFTKNIQHYNLGFQVLPWLETNFRYSGTQRFDPVLPANLASPVYFDRSFAAKVRLWNEEDFLPAFAIGANDIVGTGIYGGEYAVASKQFGPIDLTLGLGWGRLGSTDLFKNPLIQLSQSFANRPYLGTAGGSNFNVFFHGPNTGLFGGASWATPLEGLTLIAEYSSDRYIHEAIDNAFTPHTQLNIGAQYRLNVNTSFGISYLYGESIGANFAFDLDPKTDASSQRLGPNVPDPRTRSDEEQQEALNLMVASRRGTRTPATQFSQSEILADMLWQDRATQDVSVKGNTLTVVTVRNDTQNVCHTIADLTARSDAKIDTIIVSGGRGRAQCGAGRFLMPDYSGLTYDPGATLVARPPATQTALVTIDARNAPRKDRKDAIADIKAAARMQQIDILEVDLSDSVATVYYTNGQYFAERDALNRLTRILMMQAPAEIEQFRFIAVVKELPQKEFDVLRTPAERAYGGDSDTDFASVTSEASPPMKNPLLAAYNRQAFPRVTGAIYPQFRQEFFDPTNPVGVQLVAVAEAGIDLRPGLAIGGEVDTSLFDTFNTNRPSDSLLPHVRTDFLKYFEQGKNGIGNLEADYRVRLAPNTFAIVRAGYLESMFGGAGGEILWRPEGQRWALGVDAYELWQRDFDRLFGFMPYRVFTGHVALYYASPWYDLNLAVRAGQYLAKDRGVTFEVTRRFSTGVEIGAFATLTNVSATQFGEGSFDKGIIIRIPLGWALPFNTQRGLGMDLRPVQRDGGQRMEGDAILFDETRRTSTDEMLRVEEKFDGP